MPVVARNSISGALPHCRPNGRNWNSTIVRMLAAGEYQRKAR